MRVAIHSVELEGYSEFFLLNQDCHYEFDQSVCFFLFTCGTKDPQPSIFGELC